MNFYPSFISPYSVNTSCTDVMAYDHHTAFPDLMLPGCLKRSQNKRTLGNCYFKTILKSSRNLKMSYATRTCCFRKKIAKDFYLIAKNVVTLKE